MREIAASSQSPREAYALITSFIVPRPIAWVTTMEHDYVNVAPFSYFSGLGSDPPLLTLGIASRANGDDKDTLHLLRRTGVACVHLVEADHLEAMNASSADLERGCSELPLTGLGVTPCVAIGGVRLVGVRAGLECRLRDVHRYTGQRGATSLVVLEVVHAFIDDDITDDNGGGIDTNKLAMAARLGGANYLIGGNARALARPAR